MQRIANENIKNLFAPFSTHVFSTPRLTAKKSPCPKYPQRRGYFGQELLFRHQVSRSSNSSRHNTCLRRWCRRNLGIHETSQTSQSIQIGLSCHRFVAPNTESHKLTLPPLNGDVQSSSPLIRYFGHGALRGGRAPQRRNVARPERSETRRRLHTKELLLLRPKQQPT